jgi:hypothetical protein
MSNDIRQQGPSSNLQQHDAKEALKNQENAANIPEIIEERRRGPPIFGGGIFVPLAKALKIGKENKKFPAKSGDLVTKPSKYGKSRLNTLATDSDSLFGQESSRLDTDIPQWLSHRARISKIAQAVNVKGL